MEKLNEFYEYENKLLYASRDFIGYDPLISIPLSMPEFIKGEEIKSDIIFTLADESFKAVLSAGMYYGPIRGFKDIKIFNDDKLIISNRKGGHGHGSNYNEGKSYYIHGPKCYLVIAGHSLEYDSTKETYKNLEPSKYYLLIFKGISIPTLYPDIEVNLTKDVYSKEELEQYRQVKWKGQLALTDANIKIESSEVTGFAPSINNGSLLYKKFKWMSALNKTTITINESKFEFESYL